MSATNAPWKRVLRRRLLSGLLLALVRSAAAAETDPELEARRAADRGAFGESVTHWREAVALHRGAGRTNAELRAVIALAGAWQTGGQPRRAVEVLEAALERAGHQTDSALTGRLRAALGSALLLTRETDRAVGLLNDGLASARAANDPAQVAAVLNDLGNGLAQQEKPADALAAFAESAASAKTAGDLLRQARALANAASVAARSGEGSQADELNSRALTEAERLPATHERGLLLITCGLTDQRLQTGAGATDGRFLQRAQRAFRRGLETGEELGDTSLQSHALGNLARLYAEDRQPEAALTLTRRAIATAQQAGMPEALYRWEWQLGRLFAARGETDSAIAAYRRAVQTLQPIRQDLALGHGNVTAPLAFRDAQGPLFLELADLLLRAAGPDAESGHAQALLREARDAVEQLKAVELEDYFRDDCVNLQRDRVRTVESVDARTAVLYVIPFPERTELLLGLASGLKRFTVDVGAATLAARVRDFRRNLETRTTHGYLVQARELHDWLIRPIRPVLTERRIDTLVLVPDGALRTIPLATLYDGERFLIEDFAVAVAPGLSLVDPQPIRRDHARLLLGGLSAPVQGFPPLSYVPEELDSVGALFRASRRLTDAGFTLERIRRRLTEEQFSVVHLASHGQFNREARRTFVLTYDSRLTLDDLESVIRPAQYRGRPVELLVLSACQTAAGDDRAALGLAGVAVKAGARSALATLWFVNDQSTTALVREVYGELRRTPSTSKAQALRTAQLRMLADRRYRHPCYWSPYQIIGNWL